MTLDLIFVLMQLEKLYCIRFSLINFVGENAIKVQRSNRLYRPYLIIQKLSKPQVLTDI